MRIIAYTQRQISFWLVATVINVLFIGVKLHAQDTIPPARLWSDSILAQMSDTALLGQLIMLRAHSNWDKDQIDQLANQIATYQVGGLCFFQGGPGRQLQLVNRYQELANIPLFIAMDAEWGLAMRLDSTIDFPRQMALGAVRDNDLIFQMGKEIGRQLRRVGATINFAPVVDVNNNAANPVINYRSFGENRYEVTAKAFQYIKGLEMAGVMACAKHFPGHGDTETDSHVGLPVIPYDRDRLDSLELFPFRSLSNQVPSIMIAHLQVHALDSAANQPTTLSKAVVTGLLKEQLNYTGLVFTDAMDMGGVTKSRPVGRAEAEALAAGNDMVLIPLKIKPTMDTLLAWLQQGKLKRAQIVQSVRKVLEQKYRMGLSRFTPIPSKGLYEDLNGIASLTLKQQLFSKAATLIRDDQDLVPYKAGAHKRPLIVRMGGGSRSAFMNSIQRQIPDAEQILLSGNEPLESTLSRIDAKNPDYVLVTLEGLRQYPTNKFGLKPLFPAVLSSIGDQYPTLVILMGNPYAGAFLNGPYSLLCTFQDDPLAQQVASEIVLGRQAVSGKLPVTISAESPAGSGIIKPASVQE